MISILFILFLLAICVLAFYKLGLILGGIISFFVLYPLFLVFKKMTKQTNYELANAIAARHPRSHRFMQDILVKIDENKGEKIDLSGDIRLLITFLKQETNEFGDDEREMTKCFVSLFSEAFPNWQREYSVLGLELEKYFSKS